MNLLQPLPPMLAILDDNTCAVSDHQDSNMFHLLNKVKSCSAEMVLEYLVL